MGGDGGTIPSRREFITTTKKQPIKEDPRIKRRSLFQVCAISQTPLVHPIVADPMGRMYTKEMILERLLSQSLPPPFKYVKLKELVELKLTKNDGTDQHAPATQDDGDLPPAEHMCPVAFVPMDGKYKFVYLRTCGHAFSEKALKELPDRACPMCQVPYNALDVITLNPEDEEAKQMKQRMKDLKAEKKHAKKAERAEAEIVGPAPPPLMDDGSDEGRGPAPARPEVEDAAEKRKRKREDAAPQDLPAAKKAAVAKLRAAARKAEKDIKPVPKVEHVDIGEIRPEGATPEVWRSMFTSSVTEQAEETFLCRSTTGITTAGLGKF